MNSNKWKFPHQKTKRERQQPSDRSHLGFLEKKKDYLQRAERQHKKDKFVHDLKREAALRNPDEFYFSMITDTKNKQIETKSKPLKSFNKEQRLLLETRDQAYIQSKLQSHINQLEKLKARLPLPPKKPIRYFSTIEEALAAKAEEEAKNKENEEVEDSPEIAQLKDEIAQRKKIIHDLQEVYDEFQLRKDLKDGVSREIVDDDGNVSFEWKKERKR